MSKKFVVQQAKTAGDIMSHDVVTVSDDIVAAEAAKVLYAKSIGGVPVVDEQGRCVGVLSATDFMRISRAMTDPHAQLEACPFQVHHRGIDGSEGTICTLPSGLCPLQGSPSEVGSNQKICRFPNEIVVEWQALQPPLSLHDPVRRWMTSPPITVNKAATLTECAKRMAQARIHRLVVLNDDERVIGLLSSMDLLAALAETQK